jgi:hypothetical protein
VGPIISGNTTLVVFFGPNTLYCPQKPAKIIFRRIC